MKRILLLGASIALSLSNQVMAGSGTTVRAFADYTVDQPGSPRSDSQDQQEAIGPVSVSVADPAGKANSSATADYGLLGAQAEIDPDLGSDSSFYAYSIANFFDFLTISGDNVGSSGTATIRMRVVGDIRQPFIVTEVMGYAQAVAELGASSGVSDVEAGIYNVLSPDSPLIKSFDDVLEVNVPFTVGGTISLYAFLEANAESSQLSVDPDVEKFSALFGSTAEILPIFLRGVSNPVIVAESGATYAVAVPEPGCALLAFSFSMATALVRVRRQADCRY